MTDEALDLLHEIAADVRVLRQLAERGCGGDPKADAALLLAIHVSCGNFIFTSADLASHSALPAAAELRAAVVAAVGTLAPRRIGKTLLRLEGRSIGGLMVQRTGDCRDGIEWRICARVSNSHSALRQV